MKIYLVGSFMNKGDIEKSKICACYKCMKIIDKEKIIYLAEKDFKETGLCPECGLDTIITDNLAKANNRELNDELLKEINNYAFGKGQNYQKEVSKRIGKF